MSCEVFEDILAQYVSRNIIKNVHCLSVEVNNVVGNYFANILEVTCLSLTNSNESQNLITKKLSFSNPATYLFLVDKKTFSKFFIGKLIEKLEEFQNVENEINTLDKLDKFFKELEEILKNENLKKVDSNRETDKNKKKKEKLREELKRCLNLRNYNYFPLYVGSTNNFCLRYGSFVASLLSGMRYPHVFGGELHEHLRNLPNFQPNFQPIEMCLVVFYTNEVKKSNGKGYEKDKAKCIEHFILKHPNFCKIFNDEDGDCLGIRKIKRIAEDIENEAKKIIQQAQKIIQKAKKINDEIKKITEAKEAKDIEGILEIIKKEAKGIKEEAEQIINIGKEAKDIKEKAEDIEKIIENIENIIKGKYEEIINAIKIADDIIKTIRNLQSCP